MQIKGLYAIIDNTLTSHLSHPELAEKILRGGAKIIQLRAKPSLSSKKPAVSDRELFETAKIIRELTRQTRASLIINDRADIASAVEADGLHLGQDDLPLANARKILGKNKVIGISTHNIEEAERAGKEGADYIGFGPIFSSETKGKYIPPQGIKSLKQVTAAIDLPIIAIGGINEKNIEEVIQAGADGAAIISAITTAEDITAKTRHFVDLFNKT
ncbi:MAG: thiamine phosphate synthase [Deltaproteobacteria bacterium]|nr:MAG: thiamine phosphate synthase [Deltaproteobacteria bacterium]